MLTAVKSPRPARGPVRRRPPAHPEREGSPTIGNAPLGICVAGANKHDHADARCREGGHTRLDARRFWQDQSDTVPRSNGGVVSSVSPAATAKAMKPPAAHNSIAMMKGMRVASYARAKPRQ